MKHLFMRLTILGIAITLLAGIPCQSKAVVTNVTANLTGPHSLSVYYRITLENAGSTLRYVHIYAQNSITQYQVDTYVQGNLALQGPATRTFIFDVYNADSGSYYCGGDCQGNNASGRWYAGSNQVLVTVP